ncbi:MAG: hypothetical protein ABSF10_15615 [Verrucomicrobiota bacterium]
MEIKLLTPTPGLGIEVSIGRRSRSPLIPLSLCLMSRADFWSVPGNWAVVGWVMGFGIGQESNTILAIPVLVEWFNKTICGAIAE